MPRVYSAHNGLGFAQTFEPPASDDTAGDDSTGGFMETAGTFIQEHKTGVIAACAGIFALAIFGELSGRR